MAQSVQVHQRIILHFITVMTVFSNFKATSWMQAIVAFSLSPIAIEVLLFPTGCTLHAPCPRRGDALELEVRSPPIVVPWSPQGTPAEEHHVHHPTRDMSTFLACKLCRLSSLEHISLDMPRVGASVLLLELLSRVHCTYFADDPS